MLRSILRNFLDLVVGAGLGKGLYLLAIIISARTLGPEQWGTFSYAFAILAFLHVISDFGFHTLIMREVAAERLGYFAIKRIAVWRILLGVGATCVTYAWLEVTDASAQIRWALAYLAASLLFRSYYASIRSALLGSEKTRATILLDTFLFGGFLLIVVAIERAGTGDPVIIAGAWLFATIVCAAAAWYMQRRYIYSKTAGQPELSGSASLLKAAFPFVFINALVIVFHRVDIFMLEQMRTMTEVGYYAVAYQLFEAIVLIPGLLTIAVFPRLVRGELDSRRSVNLFASLSAILTTSVAILCWFAADYLLPFLFGAYYDTSIRVFRVLLMGLPFMAVTTIFAHSLFARGLEKFSAFATASALGTNVLLNIVWIPEFGMEGAAWATAVALALNSALHFLLWGTLRGKDLVSNAS